MSEAQVHEVYAALRKLAAKRLASEAAGQTISATALVHEAWLKLAEALAEWRDRSHYFRAAATAVRRILVDRARPKLAAKRGGVAAREPLSDVAKPEKSTELVALDEALNRLAAAKPDHARLVELRYFVGLTGDEAAAALGVSPAGADRMWRFARAWLNEDLS
jgi:RNA polymerase sigma factor (TIGR02999 family)